MENILSVLQRQSKNSLILLNSYETLSNLTVNVSYIYNNFQLISHMSRQKEFFENLMLVPALKALAKCTRSTGPVSIS